MWTEQTGERDKTRNLEQNMDIYSVLGAGYPQCPGTMLVLAWLSTTKADINPKNSACFLGVSELLQKYDKKYNFMGPVEILYFFKC